MNLFDNEMCMTYYKQDSLTLRETRNNVIGKIFITIDGINMINILMNNEDELIGISSLITKELQGIDNYDVSDNLNWNNITYHEMYDVDNSTCVNVITHNQRLNTFDGSNKYLNPRQLEIFNYYLRTLLKRFEYFNPDLMLHKSRSKLGDKHYTDEEWNQFCLDTIGIPEY